MRWFWGRVVALVGYLARLFVGMESRLSLLGTVMARERACPPGVSLSQRIWALRRGHFSNRVLLWNLGPENVGEFIPDIPYLRAHPLNGRFSNLIDSKFQLYFTLGPFAGLLPRLYAFVHEGTMYGRHPGVPACAPYDPESILGLLDAVGHLFVKPDGLAEGEGAFSLERTADGYRIGPRESTREEVLTLVGGLSNHLVTECLTGHEYSRRLFPGSLNTFRILVLRADGASEPRIVAAYHRVGTSASAPVDNVGRGGLCGRIDLETGRTSRFLGRPTTFPTPWHVRHPETGEMLEGIEVPGWPEIRRKVLELGRYLPMIQWMGCDLVVTPDGVKLLEINSLSSLTSQTWEPLARDPEVRRFFERRLPGVRLGPAAVLE